MLRAMRYRLVRSVIRLLLRCGVDERELEAAVLRHQLKILRRGGARPRFTTADRAFLAGAARLLSRGRWDSFLVRPDTSSGGTESSRGEGAGTAPPARTSSARSLDQEPDPSVRPGEPQVGLPEDPRRAPAARDRRVRHDHRHGASPKRPRPGATAPRADLDAVPEGTGVGPALPRVPIRRAGPGSGSAPGST